MRNKKWRVSKTRPSCGPAEFVPRSARRTLHFTFTPRPSPLIRQERNEFRSTSQHSQLIAHSSARPAEHRPGFGVVGEILAGRVPGELAAQPHGDVAQVAGRDRAVMAEHVGDPLGAPPTQAKKLAM